jgi:hypothetical protein
VRHDVHVIEKVEPFLEAFGNGRDGPLFGGVRGGELAESTYCRVWRKARVAVLSPAEVASPLRGGRTTYGTRGVHMAECRGTADAEAEWAGHSVAGLLQIHAKCLAGQVDAARRRMDAALSEAELQGKHGDGWTPSVSCGDHSPGLRDPDGRHVFGAADPGVLPRAPRAGW